MAAPELLHACYNQLNHTTTQGSMLHRREGHCVGEAATPRSKKQKTDIAVDETFLSYNQNQSFERQLKTSLEISGCSEFLNGQDRTFPTRPKQGL